MTNDVPDSGLPTLDQLADGLVTTPPVGTGKEPRRRVGRWPVVFLAVAVFVTAAVFASARLAPAESESRDDVFDVARSLAEQALKINREWDEADAIMHGTDRDEAIAKARAALERLVKDTSGLQDIYEGQTPVAQDEQVREVIQQANDAAVGMLDGLNVPGPGNKELRLASLVEYLYAEQRLAALEDR